MRIVRCASEWGERMVREIIHVQGIEGTGTQLSQKSEGGGGGGEMS